MTAPDDRLSLHSLFQEFSAAWERIGIYPEGHPAREGAAERLLERLRLLVAPTGSLSFGVLRDGLISGSEKLTSGPAAQIAHALFTRNVAVFRILEGLNAAELTILLQQLRGDPADEELPIWDELSAAGVHHIQLEPVDYSAIEATADLSEPEVGEGQEPAWETTLAARLSGRPLSSHLQHLGTTASSSFAEIVLLANGYLELCGDRSAGMEQTIEGPTRQGAPEAAGPAGGGVGSAASDESGAAGAPGSAESGFGVPGAGPGEPPSVTLPEILSQFGPAVTRHLESARTTATRDEALPQLNELLNALPQELRPGLLEAALRGVAAVESVEALGLFAASVSGAELAAALRRLKEADQALSPRAVRVLEELVLKQGPGPSTESAAGEATPSLSQLREFFAEEDLGRQQSDLANYNRSVLELPCQVEPTGIPLERLEAAFETLDQVDQVRRFAVTLLDLLDKLPADSAAAPALATRLSWSFHQLITHGQAELGLEAVERLKEVVKQPDASAAARAAAEECLELLAGKTLVVALVESLGHLPDGSLARLRQLVAFFGPAVIRQLLESLADEEEMHRRRHLFDFIGSLGEGIVPYAIEMLEDRRWYVVRNMVGLLSVAGDRQVLQKMRPLLTHPELRVRTEAYHMLFSLEQDQVGSAIVRQGLSDPSRRIRELVIHLAGHHATRSAREPLLDLLGEWDLFGRNTALRVKALQSLAQLGESDVLPAIRRSFGGGFLSVRKEEIRAAYTALASYPEASRRPWIKTGSRSRDPEIRAICERLRSASPSPAVEP